LTPGLIPGARPASAIEHAAIKWNYRRGSISSLLPSGIALGREMRGIEHVIIFALQRPETEVSLQLFNWLTQSCLMIKRIIITVVAISFMSSIAFSQLGYSRPKSQSGTQHRHRRQLGQ
jgi:hypothetical protein